MSYKLLFTEQAAQDLARLETKPNLAKRLKAVKKALGYLETNPRHPSLKLINLPLLKASVAKKYLRHMLKIKPLLLIVFFGIMGLAKILSL